MDKTVITDQMGRLRGILINLAQNRIVWITLGSILYFLGCASDWYKSTGPFSPHFGFIWAYDSISLLTGIMMLLAIPFIIIGINKLKFPIDRILWFSVWIIVYFLFVPLIRAYAPGYGFTTPMPLIYLGPVVWEGLQGQTINIHIFAVVIIIIPIWFMLRPQGLQRSLRLLTMIILGNWGIADCVGLYFVFRSTGTSYLEGGTSTEVGLGLPLILAGIVVWLAIEILEWRSQKPEDAAVKKISA